MSAVTVIERPAPSPHRVDDPDLPESVQQEFFEQSLARAKDAEEAAGRVCMTLDLAGTIVQLVFAGPALSMCFAPALEHLRIPDGEQRDLVLHVWDSESTGVPMVDPPVTSDAFTDRGDIWGMRSRRFRSAFHWVESSVNLLDIETGTGMYWVQSAGGLPFWCMASPLRTLFHWWIEHTGGQLLHGAAIGNDSSALLITGKGGVGKSTTALVSLLDGMQYVGDDYLAVRLDPEPRVFSLYCTAKLTEPQMKRFPMLEQHVANDGFRADEKAVVRLLPAFATQVVRSLPLTMIATPVFAGEEATTFAPVAPIALQRAATFTTTAQLPHAGAALHAFMQRLALEVPSAQMRLGSRIDAIPSAIRELLASPALSKLTTAEPAMPLATRPLVSVVIPVYNGTAFLPDAIASILAQEYSPLEIIVVDDGSTDDIEGAVASLPVDVRFFRQGNAGAAAARNRGIRDASADLIAFLDVDDLWPDGNLQRMVDLLLSAPDACAVHGRAQALRMREGAEPEFVGDPKFAFPHYIGAGLYRREVFTQVGLYDPSLRFGEDSDWFKRAIEVQAPILSVDEVSLFVRRHAANMTRGKSQVELHTLRVLKKVIERKRAASDAPRSPNDDA